MFLLLISPLFLLFLSLSVCVFVCRDRLFLLHLEQQLIDFVNNDEKQSARFPPMTSYHRMLVHRVSAYFGLEHNIDAGGKAVVVMKTQATRLPKQRFKEHLQLAELGVNISPRAILKRVVPEAASSGESVESSSTVADDRPMKSIEEREAEYEQRRARIFNQPAGGRTTPPSSVPVSSSSSVSHVSSVPSSSSVSLVSSVPSSSFFSHVSVSSSAQENEAQCAGFHKPAGLPSASSVSQPTGYQRQSSSSAGAGSFSSQRRVAVGQASSGQRQSVSGSGRRQSGGQLATAVSASRPLLPLQSTKRG